MGFRFGIDDPVPATREDKARLVGGYLGSSRPGYGDASRTPVWWPEEVPWLKGVSISQVRRLSRARERVCVRVFVFLLASAARSR